MILHYTGNDLISPKANIRHLRLQRDNDYDDDDVLINRGVARNLLQGDKRGGMGMEVPQRGPGAEP